MRESRREIESLHKCMLYRNGREFFWEREPFHVLTAIGFSIHWQLRDGVGAFLHWRWGICDRRDTRFTLQ